MTWGAILMRLPKDMTIREMEEQLGDDWQSPPVGTVEEVRNALTSLFPDARQNPNQTVYDQGYVTILFNYLVTEGTDEVSSIGISSNGDQDSIPILKSVCEALDLRMVDAQTGEVADFENETQESMKDFRDYRDRSLRDYHEREKET